MGATRAVMEYIQIAWGGCWSTVRPRLSTTWKFRQRLEYDCSKHPSLWIMEKGPFAFKCLGVILGEPATVRLQFRWMPAGLRKPRRHIDLAAVNQNVLEDFVRYSQVSDTSMLELASKSPSLRDEFSRETSSIFRFLPRKHLRWKSWSTYSMHWYPFKLYLVPQALPSFSRTQKIKMTFSSGRFLARLNMRARLRMITMLFHTAGGSFPFIFIFI